MQIARAVPKTDFAILAAHQYHRVFRIKRHHRLGNDGLGTRPFPRAGNVAPRRDPRLSLAVITKADGFQNAGHANRINRRGQCTLVLRHSKFSSLAAKRAHEIFFRSPILRYFQCFERWVNRNKVSDRFKRRHGHIFKFESYNIARVGKCLQCGQIIIFGDSICGTHIARDIITRWRVNMAAIAQLRSGDRKHTAKLTAA